MNKSELTHMEVSGVLRKIKILSLLDPNTGIIKEDADKIQSSLRAGLDNFSRGAFNGDFGKDILNSIISGNGVEVLSAENNAVTQTATFAISFSSVFDDRTLQIKYPHGEY